MTKQPLSDAVLGISVTPSKIEAALLRQSGKHFRVVSRFSRQRVKEGELVGAGSLATVLPGLQGNDEADFTIQIGDSNGNNSGMFLSGEFVGLGTKTVAGTGGGTPSTSGLPTLFVKQLKEILAECRKLGYAQPKIAFCVGAPDVSYIKLYATRDQVDSAGRKKWGLLSKEDAEGLSLDVNRRRLLELLTAQHPHPGGFDPARVAFVPMTPLRGQHRYLAIVPERGEPVTATLKAMTAQQKAAAPTSRILGTDVSLYTALARKALAPTKLENTAIVRIGSEDTLILFLSGTQLQHFDRLRSLTTYDPPETICSRVLLQQDEHKIGAVHQVLVQSETHNEQFLDAFRTFYPNAGVKLMQTALFNRGVETTREEDGLRSGFVTAAGIGLNLLEAWERDDPFGAVNLLPKKLRQKRRQRLALPWHTLAMFLVLFGVTLLFTRLYVEQQGQLDRGRAELQYLNMPDPTVGSASALQARVDSLRRVYQQYTHALQVLDSLLIGSDQWSRTLEKTSRATRDLDGVWFESWQPVGSSIRIRGYARSRERVAQFADRLDGAIHETSFSDVKDVRIHPFTVVVPRPIALPRVAEYLKEGVDGIDDYSSDAGRAGDASNEP